MGKQSKKIQQVGAQASVPMIKISPRKLNLVAGLIRGKKVIDALNMLEFSRRRIAGEVKKVLNSAIANAENNHSLDPDRLYVKEVLVGKALLIKRFHARARGRAGKILKPYSNISIRVDEMIAPAVQKKAAKTTENLSKESA